MMNITIFTNVDIFEYILLRLQPSFDPSKFVWTVKQWLIYQKASNLINLPISDRVRNDIRIHMFINSFEFVKSYEKYLH